MLSAAVTDGVIRAVVIVYIIELLIEKKLQNMSVDEMICDDEEAVCAWTCAELNNSEQSVTHTKMFSLTPCIVAVYLEYIIIQVPTT